MVYFAAAVMVCAWLAAGVWLMTHGFPVFGGILCFCSLLISVKTGKSGGGSIDGP